MLAARHDLLYPILHHCLFLILLLFVLQSNMVSPFALHQQQIAMLAQQQSLLVAAAAKSAGNGSKLSGTVQQPGSNGTNLPGQTWLNAGYQVPGVMPLAGQVDLQKLMQVCCQQLWINVNSYVIYGAA